MLAREVEPSLVHRLIAALPAFLRARGQRSPLWLFTTNYDVVLERELAAAGEEIHVLSYIEKDGLFVHTAPDASVRVIERPEAIRDLEPPRTVVVRLHGGIVFGPGTTSQ